MDARGDVLVAASIVGRARGGVTLPPLATSPRGGGASPTRGTARSVQTPATPGRLSSAEGLRRGGGALPPLQHGGTADAVDPLRAAMAWKRDADASQSTRARRTHSARATMLGRWSAL